MKIMMKTLVFEMSLNLKVKIEVLLLYLKTHFIADSLDGDFASFEYLSTVFKDMPKILLLTICIPPTSSDVHNFFELLSVWDVLS